MKKLLLTIGLITTMFFGQIAFAIPGIPGGGGPGGPTNYQEGVEAAATQAAADTAASEAAQAQYDSDCYGYAGGDTQDASDFALKIDCILDTTEQDQSYFNDTSGEPGGTSPIENVIIRAINYLMATIGSVSLLLIVIAGVMMITSPGNENQRSKATEILTSSIIALVIAFSSFIIVNFVQGLFF